MSSSYMMLAFLASVTASSLAFEKDILNWRSLADRINRLPELDEMPSFDMFSGYLDVSTERRLFYWLNECVNTSSNKLIIWFNGGPGCSSLDGLFVEHGPFQFNPSNGRLMKNPYSWNRLAHTLYIESPAGVGFSINTNEDEAFDDDSVAKDNLVALEMFFDKFPSYRNYELYISGESYGGVYVPTLVSAIIKENSWMAQSIKGIMIGNGLLNKELNENSLVAFAYYHGLFGAFMWRDLHRYCCDREGNCNFYLPMNEDCMVKTSKVHHITSNSGLNLYDLYAKCTSESQNALQNHFVRERRFSQDNDVLAMTRTQNEGNNLKLIPPCSNASLMTDYLNKQLVKEAIHATSDKTWEICNGNVLSRYDLTYDDVTPFIKDILESLDDARMLLYFGDTDMACNFMGGEWFFDQIGYEIMTPRRRWTVEAEDGTTQIAGFYKEYDRIAFVTVKGAGHMVPADKPKEAFYMLERFIAEEPL